MSPEEQRKEQEKKLDAVLSNFRFDSDCFQCYFHDKPTELQKCSLFIKIRKEMNGNQHNNDDCYVVSSTHYDTGEQFFSPKYMRVISFSENEISLKGCTVVLDMYDSIFGTIETEKDYSYFGFSIILRKGKPEKCILYIYNRNIRIEYMKQNEEPVKPKRRY